LRKLWVDQPELLPPQEISYLAKDSMLLWNW
jgi:hypothetical protein